MEGRTGFLALVVLVLVVLASAWMPTASARYNRTVTYTGQKVLACRVNSTEEVRQLLLDPDLDVWRRSADGRLLEVRTLTAQAGVALSSNKDCQETISDVNAWLEPLEASLRGRRLGSSAMRQEFFEDYHTYDEIIGFYTSLAAEYPSLVTMEPSIGESIELRPMPAVRITAAANPQNVPRFLMTCQIHAREWVSSSTCAFMADQLVRNYEQDSRVRALLEASEVIFIPFVNPDGYAYTWSNDRLWRKNRRVNTNSACRGVDLNRNFNIRWAEPGGGSSGNPCSETYHGTAAESEPELLHLANFFRANPRIVGGIDYHSYSQLILRPWGFTLDPPPHEQQLKAVGDQMQAVIRSVHNQRYVSQPGMDLYPTVGTSSDWYFSDDASQSK